jgi:pimeloyl-ACP methyl ester carboxylesterase
VQRTGLVACGLSVLLSLAALFPQAPALADTALVKSSRFSVTGPDGSKQAAIGIWPRQRDGGERFPVVFAFHGMGESKSGPERGYLAWPEKYGLFEAYDAVLSPPVSAQAFGGLVRDAELQALNRRLAKRAFDGVFVVGVYTPEFAEEGREAALDAFAAWLVNTLLPRVLDVFPVANPEPRTAGVDGVSLGGMVALEVGLRHPEVFGAVGTMQPAVRGREVALAERAAQAMQKQPFAMRLLSSDGDPLLPVTRKLSEELRKRTVPHELVVTKGGHDYAFNRGPGAFELLSFHDRALHPR